jgi:hypothetical protein
MQRLFPENRDVAERLEALGGGEGIQYTAGMPGTIETPETSGELSGAEGEAPEAVSGGKTPWGRELPRKELVEKEPEEEFKEEEFENLSFGEHEVVDAQEMPEPVSTVMFWKSSRNSKKALRASSKTKTRNSL